MESVELDAAMKELEGLNRRLELTEPGSEERKRTEHAISTAGAQVAALAAAGRKSPSIEPHKRMTPRCR